MPQVLRHNFKQNYFNLHIFITVEFSMLRLPGSENYDFLFFPIIIENCHLFLFINRSRSAWLRLFFPLQNCFRNRAVLQAVFLRYLATRARRRASPSGSLRFLISRTICVNCKTQYLSIVKYVVYPMRNHCYISHTNMFLISKRGRKKEGKESHILYNKNYYDVHKH